jgi:uncharacterized protein DUF6516
MPLAILAVGDLDNTAAVGIIANMKAEPVMNERYAFDDRSFAELVIWRPPRVLPGSAHQFKYRLAFVVDDVCVLRYDNEAGKGDHRHVGTRQEPYVFTTVDRLLADFRRDISEWKYGHEDGDI